PARGVDLHALHMAVRAQEFPAVGLAVAVLVVVAARGPSLRVEARPDVGPALDAARQAQAHQVAGGIVILPTIGVAVEVGVEVELVRRLLPVVKRDLVGPAVAVAVVLQPGEAAGGVVERLVLAAVEDGVLAAVGAPDRGWKRGRQAAPRPTVPGTPAAEDRRHEGEERAGHAAGSILDGTLRHRHAPRLPAR